MTIFLAYVSGKSSEHTFWYSIWYIFGASLWLKSGGQHSDPVLAVERRTLGSGAYRDPAGSTLILSLLFGSSG